jgi:GDP-4-dehydro-6-deoxy-D-mannose reductase
MTRLFVTGAGGFAGRHLAAAVTAGEFGDCVWLPAPETLDIRDTAGTLAAVEAARPDAVIHLAARTFVPESFADPRVTFEVNLFGTLNLLQALRATRFDGRMIYVSSGDVYGLVPEEELPVDENRPPEPRSPYAVSKVAAEQLALQWHRSEGLDVMIARPFNHVGPSQDGRFVLASLARQVAAIAAGVHPPVIDAGDLDTTRDFTDVRDVVGAYAAMLRSGRSGRIYVIGSGRERRVRDALAQMCVLAGIAVDIRQDPSRLRPSEQRRMAANSRLLHMDTGWSPRISFETTLTDILEAARSDK